MSDEKAEIGLMGLGVMGSALALNIAEKGHRIAVWNRKNDRPKHFIDNAGDLADRIIPCWTYDDLVAAIKPPRPIILMIPAGEPVDQQISELKSRLDPEDIIIDAGNANFRDTRRRMKALAETGPRYIGMGVSGGEEGARHGPSIMVGGDPDTYRRIEKVLDDIAARFKGQPCQALLGPDGAGHFVKMIHNGIEYADMQMIAEIYGILRDGHGMRAEDIAAVFAQWNKGRLNSYLIEITAKVLETHDEESGGPLVDAILDKAGQKGTGRWTVMEAQRLGVPATAMEAAVAARTLSARKSEREAAEKAFSIPPRPEAETPPAEFISDLEGALFAGKIVAYAQGFSVLAAASAEFEWDLPMPAIARIWRAGCIIRSQFLDRIAEAFEKTPDAASLLMTPAFRDLINEAQAPLRRVVAMSAGSAVPVPALSAALAHFDGYRRARGTANLIQAQRDYFGAHGFERIGVEGEQHGPWVRD